MIGKLAIWSMFDWSKHPDNVSNIIWQFEIAYCNNILVLVSIWYSVLVTACVMVQVIWMVKLFYFVQLVMPAAVVVLLLLALKLCVAGIA